MATVRDKSVRTVGVWSAVLCTIFSLAYVLAQLGEWAGLFGSAGGPHMYYPPLIWGGSLWAITFPSATWLLAIHFSRLQVH